MSSAEAFKAHSKASRYQAWQPIQLEDRQWPNARIEQAPLWCSVDLRDGNQALVNPMTVAQKLRLFKRLLTIGFTQIEVGFPAASQADFDFVRTIIEQDLIPDGVAIQVLTQAREELVARTFEALQGCKKAVVHVYNSTNPVQRERVFSYQCQQVVELAVKGARLLQEYAAKAADTEWVFEYSPESFSLTEPEFALQVCNAVIECWQPEKGQKVIINLPATVEASMPNVFADQVEFMHRGLQQRDYIDLSVHTHNDRGCAVAAAEMALLAGADRVEGTLFGNGERTGNLDIVTMALNLYSQGIEPELDFYDMPAVKADYEAVSNLTVPVRHPYAGELVFTAFSGSHQDAIRKCLKYDNQQHWQVAYLPLDPADLNCDYQAVIRVNSQSGKAGAAFVVEQALGLELSRAEQQAFSRQVQALSEELETELTREQLLALYQQGAHLQARPDC